MLPTFLVWLYEVLHGQQENPVYRDEIYKSVGIGLIVTTLALTVVYYYILNGLWARFGRTWPNWIAFLILNVLINAALVLWITSNNDVEVFTMTTLLLCLINALYAGFGFFLSSILFKWGSPHARRTPF
jgi:hypothetical protein